MTLKELVGQTLVFGIPGKKITPRDVRLFKDTCAGGLILYRINYQSPRQIKKLVAALESALGRRLLVTVDHEGGRVVMFGGGVTVFPDGLAFGAGGSAAHARRQGAIEARELRRLGMDVNFSPTVDVLTPAFSPNIGIRSYGTDPARVAALGAARIRAMQAGGVSACAKHFPGLGPATLDPHLDLPVINATWAHIRRHHAPPFRAAIRAGVDIVMSSHPLYPKLDPHPRTPATFSEKIIRGYLRRELGFKGVISSDDLEMGALRNLCSVGQAAVLAAKAGHDLILCCHKEKLQREVQAALLEAYSSGRLPLAELEASVRRIHVLKNKRARRFQGGAPRAERAGAALALKVARRAAQLQGNAQALPSPQDTLHVIFPRFSELAARIMIEGPLQKETAFLKASFQKHPGPKTYGLVSIDPTPAQIRREVRAARAAEAAVYFCFDAHLQPGCRRLLEALQQSVPKLTVVLLRDPYDREFLAPSTAGVTAFGFRLCQIRACIEKLNCLLPPSEGEGRDGGCFVGVDLGGSRLRVQALDGRGRPRLRHEGPAVPPHKLSAALASLWKKWRLSPDNLTVGSKGVWLPAERKNLHASLRGLAGNVQVVSDVELAHAAAFGPAGAGVLLIGGTGSIALGRGKNGRWARTGGLGPKTGDEGSGYWIGKEFLKGRKKNVAATAALAPMVLKRARRDALCAGIVRRAQGHLAQLVLQTAKKLKFKGPVPVACAGGLFKNANFRRGFRRALNETGLRYKIISSRRDAALTAALWAGAASSPLPRR